MTSTARPSLAHAAPSLAASLSGRGHRGTDYLKYLASLVLFGTNGIVASMIALPSHELVLLRTLVGGLALVAVLLLSRRTLFSLTYCKEAGFVALSGVALGLSWMFLFEAYRQVGVQVASLAYYCGPIIVMALSPLLFHERLGAGKLAGFAAVLLGIVLVNGTAAENGLPLGGLACGGASAVMYAVMVICNKKGAAVGGLENSAIQLVSAFVASAAASALIGAPLVVPTAADIPVIVVLCLVNTALGCYLYFGTIGHLPVQTVAVCGYLEPLSAVVFSALLLGETMAPAQVAGAALIVGGAVFCEMAPRLCGLVGGRPAERKLAGDKPAGRRGGLEA